GGRAGRGRQPLAGALQSTPFSGAALQVVVPAGGASTRKCHPCGRLSPFASVGGLPFGLALAAASCPLVRGLGRGLAVGGRPCLGTGRGWPHLLLTAFVAKT
ncbi:hypothetical protein B296_00049438, partial [Ensete ventricosum]